MNEWQKLKARYPSISAYSKRIALKPKHLEAFTNWIVDKGADVLTFKAQNEILRFSINGALGIWYTSGSGNLAMHDYGEEFSSKEITKKPGKKKKIKENAYQDNTNQTAAVKTKSDPMEMQWLVKTPITLQGNTSELVEQIFTEIIGQTHDSIQKHDPNEAFIFAQMVAQSAIHCLLNQSDTHINDVAKQLHSVIDKTKQFLKSQN